MRQDLFNERGTGRTSRMLRDAVKAKRIEHPSNVVLTRQVIIVMPTADLISYALSLEAANGLVPRDFITVTSLNLERRLRDRSETQVFVDHAVWDTASWADLRRLDACLRGLR